MRNLLSAVIVLLAAAPGFAADRSPLLDAYYACLVGRGAVEVHYGLPPEEALRTADKSCGAEVAAIDVDDPDNEDPGDQIEAIFQVARDALVKLAPEHT